MLQKNLISVISQISGRRLGFAEAMELRGVNNLSRELFRSKSLITLILLCKRILYRRKSTRRELAIRP